MSQLYYQKIEDVVADFARGQMMIMVDDEGRENEGDLIIAAEFADAAAINFMCHHGRGLICLPMLSSDFARLQIPMMAQHNRSPYHTAFGIGFEAATDVTTGISAADRARSVAVAIDPNSGPADVVMPGHMFPLRAMDGGVLQRPGHTEGCVDMARLAGLKPAGVLCEIMNADGSMARRDALEQFAQQHDLKIVCINALVAWREQHDPQQPAKIKKSSIASSAELPTRGGGNFVIHSFNNALGGADHLALVAEGTQLDQTCLVRVHSECVTGDVFGSTRCDCGAQRTHALDRIAREGGVFIYLRQEGRGIGITNKIKAYALQDQGMDTVEANHHLGFADDERSFDIAAQILHALNVKSVKLMTNNPRKVAALAAAELSVIREPLQVPATDENIFYMKTKQRKLGHLLEF